MTGYRQRAARIERENPITDKHRLWAAWFWGCIGHYFPERARCPAHPTLAREYFGGRNASASGLVIIGDCNEAVALCQHVERGGVPHTFGKDA